MTIFPEMTCKAGCADCCGPIPFTKDEVAAATARAPLLKVTWVRVGENAFFAKEALETMSCPYVKGGNTGCAIYDVRPPICRVFGVVDTPLLTCPHGCGPSKKITVAECNRYLFETITGATPEND